MRPIEPRKCSFLGVSQGCCWIHSSESGASIATQQFTQNGQGVRSKIAFSFRIYTKLNGMNSLLQFQLLKALFHHAERPFKAKEAQTCYLSSQFKALESSGVGRNSERPLNARQRAPVSHG